MIITRQFLHNNPSHVFVFGDNTLRQGRGGAAALRDMPNTYGFITKIFPNNTDDAFYNITSYQDVYQQELQKLMLEIENNPDKTYLISKIGSGLANRYHIFEQIIEPNIKYALREFSNVIFLW